MISGNTKITLTIGQLRRLVNEMTIANNVDEITDESLQSTFGLALIASLLSLGSILKADDIKTGLQDATSPQEAQVVLNALETKTYGGFSTAQTTNILTRTLYDEARGESHLGRLYVATVIWNRAGGTADNLPGVCLKRKQFSGWNKVAGKTPGSYKIKVPKGATKPGADQKAWKDCQTIVEQLMDGTFVPVGNYNSYLNKDTADKSAVDGWGSKMTGQIKVGRHTFGYLPENDGFKGSEQAPKFPTTCKVQKGDYGISYVAKRLIKGKQTSYSSIKDLTDKIIELNPKLKTDRKGNPIIRVGDVLNLPT